MKKLILFSLVLFSFISCQKEDVHVPLPCEAEHWGTLNVINQLPVSVKVYADNVHVVTVAANSEKLQNKIDAGNTRIDFSATGYVIPGLWVEIDPCEIQPVGVK